MNATKRLVGALALVAAGAFTIGVDAAATQSASTWRDLLAARTRVAYRYTHPASPGQCGTAELPATGRVLVPATDEPIGRTWQAGPNHSRWEPITGPAGGPPLEVNVVELWCGPTGESLLVETDGYYLEIYASRLASVDEVGTLTPGVFLADSEDGEAIQVTLRQECAGGVCRFVFLDAGEVASGVAASVAQRMQADRARLDEATRRAEADAQARLQTSASVGAQSRAVAQRQQAEILQRYGATEEQARAILQRRVIPGMTAAMVRAALGEPTRITAETVDSRTTETWSYPGRQVILVDDRVTEIR